MNEKYVVRLSADEREELRRITKKLSGSSQKVRRANILLMADADGPNWVDAQIAEAFSCRVRTIEKLRKRLVTKGFQEALNGKPRERPPRKKVLLVLCFGRRFYEGPHFGKVQQRVACSLVHLT